MRSIWLLTTEFPPYHGGGIATYSAKMADLFAERGVSTTVFVTDWRLEEPLAEDEYRGHRVIRFHPERLVGDIGLRHTAPVAYGFKTLVLREIERTGPPDIIEAQDYQAPAYFLLTEKLARNPLLARVPIAVMLHSPEYVVRPANLMTTFRFPEFWSDEMERFCIRAADAVWTPSRYVTEHLGPEFGGVKTSLIRNPFALETMPEPSARRSGFFFFGRVQILKGVLETLEAYQNLAAGGFNEPLQFIGGDSHFHARGMSVMDYIRKRYRKLVDNGSIVFHGLKPREEALSLLRSARVVLTPSKYENFPYAVLEAMALERVVVCSKQGGQSEILEHMKNAVVFDHAVRGDMARKIEQAFSLSDAQMTELGRNARLTVARECNPDTFLARKTAVVEQTIADHRPPAERRTYPFLRIEQPSAPARRIEPGATPGLVSIIIPYFNLGAFVDDAIRSVRESHHANWEIVVANSESTDPGSVVKFYQLMGRYADDPRMRFELIEDRGLAFSRNEGARLARGEHLLFLDPDDVLHPDYIGRCVAILDTYQNVGAVGSWVQSFEGSTGRWPTWNTEPPYILFHNCINTASMMFRRSVFLACAKNDVGMFVGMEDYEAMIRMVGAGYGAVAIPDFLFRYRVRADSMMRTLIKINDVYSYERIAQNNKQLFERFATSIVGLLNGNGPGFRHDNPLVEAPL